MRSLALRVAVLLLVHIAMTLAMYDSRDDVLELNSKNFDKEVINTEHLVAVEFYAPWCGHCQRLAPDWKKAAKNLKGLVKVAAINCDEENAVCGEYDIKGFPTIKIFSPLKPSSSTKRKRPTDYQGPRTAKAIVDHLLSNQPSKVTYVVGDQSKVKSQRSITLDNFLATENSTLPKVLLFTDKLTTTPLYKALSVEFSNGKMLLGEVKKSEKEVTAQFGIDSFPTLLVIPPEQDCIRYDGKLQRSELLSFLTEYANMPNDHVKTKAKDKAKAKDNAKDKTEPKNTPEPRTVAAITSNEIWTKHCITSDNVICVLAILPDDDEKQESIDMLNQLNNGGSSTRFRFGWISPEKASVMMKKLDLPEDLPTLFIVQPSKHLYRSYVGAWEESAITQWLNGIASGRMPVWPYDSDLIIDEKELHDEL